MMTPSKALALTLSISLCVWCLRAENIDPDDDGSQFAYGENVGWINAEQDPDADGLPDQGILVSDVTVTGWLWGENVGWISMSCANTATCGTTPYGVQNDGNGNLSGFAWAENAGWIDFAPPNGGVTIDLASGRFGGLAWGENVGWINFGPFPNSIKTAWSPSPSRDSDGDGWFIPGDCNDGDASVYPGAPEICDGVDNNCDGYTDEQAIDAAEWYQDADGDGFGDPAVSLVSCVQPAGFVSGDTDCDDTNPTVFPNAAEMNDGVDNQCPGDSGYGLIDELMGMSGFFNASDRNEFSWAPQPMATSYEVLRSNDREFVSACSTFAVSGTAWIDSTDPAPGGAFYYLVRATSPHVGSLGRNSSGVERSVVCP